jgi:murein L,D-transpeptidase YcbB/YkuD
MNLRTFLRCALAGASLVAHAALAQAPDAIRAFTSQPQQFLPSASHAWDGQDWLERFYAPRGYQPAWSHRQAEAALALLDDAASEGLDPDDYNAAGLRDALHGPDAGRARSDVALTAAVLHYLADLRLGRVRSEYHTAGPDPRLHQFDPVALLRNALGADGRLRAAVTASEPPIPLYARIRGTLARYRAMQGQDEQVLAAPALKVRPRGSYAGVAALHERLVQLGDLEPDAPPPRGHVYDDALAAAVKRFQSRHGLEEDGVLGRDTVAALNVPLAQRVRQLDLTLERLRWLPDFAHGRVIAVNLPAYRLWAFDASQRDKAVLEMKVIVGAAVKTPTPLFIGQMRYLEFNPYWNVPRSILTKEIIPKLERNPGYLERNDMEVVGSTEGGLLAALRSGKARVRQRPGPKNSLGAVKFAMPNPMDIYLHSTPARELFRRSRRDLSHGCIRVEQPAELARFVLQDQPEWTIDEIQAALAPGPTRTVRLTGPIPVVIFYATALADREGRALFPRDVYQRDRVLERELALHSSGQASK